MGYDLETIAKRIYHLRKVENDLSRRKFAEKAGLSGRTVETYEHCQAYPSSYAVYAICKAYNVSADWLLGLKEEM